jgi:UPF0716 protein FxsA
LRYLLLLFVVMPIAEMWLLITVGREIGTFPTIGLVLLTAAVGFSLLRQQGFATFFRARQKMDAGELPAIEMVEAIILAVCGALLMTPGFVTDVIGFAGLIPGIRRGIVSRWAVQMNVVNYREYEVHSRDHVHIFDADSQTLEGDSWQEDENSSSEK